MAMGLSMRLAAEARDRGLDPERLAEKFGVHSPAGGGNDHLVIPFQREGLVRNRKYRTSLVPGSSGGKTWQDGREKKAIRLLYNEDALRRADLKGLPVIITEGEPDLWALDAAGFERVVAWPDGAPEESIPLDSDSSKYQPLDDAAKLLHQDNLGHPGGDTVPIIIAADGDEPGAMLLHDLSIRLGRPRCKFLVYPLSKRPRGRPRCKDLGEVLEDYGPEGVRKTIERAQWVAVNGVYRLSELPPRPRPVAFDIGMEHLRHSYRMRLGDWAVVTGIPSMGKSTLVNDMVCRVVEEYSADDDPMVVAFASFEQDPQVDHRRNLLWWRYGKHPAKLTADQKLEGELWIDRHFRFLVPSEDDDVTLEWALEKMAIAVVREGVRIVVLDPWNEMDHMRQPGESMTDYVGRAIKAFRRFARKMNIHLIIVAHPTKMQPRVDGTLPMPSLYSISDSANWYNKCDVGVIVHQEAQGAVIWVQKVRYHDEIGVPAMYDAIFNGGTKRFEVQGVRDPSMSS